MRTISLLPFFLIAAALAASDAAAQPATAQAEFLFREGRRLMQEGNIAAACEAFEGSFKKDASPSTLMNLADCREKNQQYASAWAHFVETARLSRLNPSLEGLAKSAQERAAKVEARLSYLIINVPDDSRVEGLTITRDGVVIEAVEWNRDIPVDGGTYAIEAKAPAYEAWSTNVTVENASDKESVNVPRFREALGGSSVAGPQGEEPSGFTGKRKLALGLGVVGIAALGGGLAFELKSGSTYDDAKAAETNDERRELTDQANRERRFAIGAAAVGTAAIGAGVYLWISGSPERAPRTAVVPLLGPDRATLTLTGRF